MDQILPLDPIYHRRIMRYDGRYGGRAIGEKLALDVTHRF